MTLNENEKQQDSIKKRDDTAYKAEDIGIKSASVESFKFAFNIYYQNTRDLFVALTKDYIKDSEPYLFCGQIGRVFFIIDKDTCFVIFEDYKSTESNVIHQLQMSKMDLFPLFFMDPNFNSKIVQEQRNSFVSYQKTFKKEDFEQNERPFLQSHKKSTNDLQVGQIITVGTDFIKYSLDENEANQDLIQAGQVGRISKLKDDGLVEVIFECTAIVSLVQGILNSRMTGYRNGWKRVITIHQDYLFPLYYKNLNENLFDLDTFLRLHKDNREFLNKFSPQRYIDTYAGSQFFCEPTDYDIESI